MKLTSIAQLALLTGLAAPGWGAVVYSSLTNLGIVSGIHNTRSNAVNFVPTGSGTLTGIGVIICQGGAPTQNLVITLRAPGPDPTGTVLEQWVITPGTLTTSCVPVTTLPSLLNPGLTAGTGYWLRMESAVLPADSYGWRFQSATPGYSLSFNSGVDWSPQPGADGLALEVNANLVGDAFQVRYFSNLAVGDSVLNFSNSGASSTSAGIPGAQNGDICANVYAYSPDEQLVSCCSCNVTPNALNSLSVRNDLASNTLTPIIPSALVVKVLVTAGGGACTASSAAAVTPAQLASGLLAWGSTIHPLPVTAGSPATTYGVTETPFAVPSLSQAELTRMTQLCAFIRANGSGYGICKSCKVGGLGAGAR